MFKLTTDEFGEVEVSFRHYLGNELKYNGVTICDITKGYKLISTGMATCSKQDNFCKETGRRLSLTRALRYFEGEKLGTATRIIQTTRELRRQFWNAYWFTKERDRAKAHNKIRKFELAMENDE